MFVDFNCCLPGNALIEIGMGLRLRISSYSSLVGIKSQQAEARCCRALMESCAC